MPWPWGIPGCPHLAGVGRLAPHVRVLVAHADEAGMAEPTARLMSDLGLHSESKALYAEAEPLMRRALAIDER